MSVALNQIFPDFTAASTLEKIHFYDYLGKHWGLLFTHPADFTPVSTTEISAVARLQNEFEKRRVKLLAISADTVDKHHSWISDIKRYHNTLVKFPLVSDALFEVAGELKILVDSERNRYLHRSVFIVGPDRLLKFHSVYPVETGRNFTELLRIIDSLQLTYDYNVSTPADWMPGEEVVIAPSVTDEEAGRYFPGGFRKTTPYLRFTPQPNLHWNL